MIPAAREKMQNCVPAPSRRTNHDEFGRLRAVPADQFAPDIDEKRMIFAWLERSANDKIVMRSQFLVRLPGSRKIGATGSGTVATGMSPRPRRAQFARHRIAGRRRGCDEGGGITGRVIRHMAMMTQAGVRNPLRILQRDHVVQHEDGFDIRPPLQPGEKPWKRKTHMSDIDIDRILRRRGKPPKPARKAAC